MKSPVKFTVSISSYRPRINTLHLCIESLFNQTYMPDKVLLYVDDSIPIYNLPHKIIDFQSRGLIISQVSSELKSHNKYFYAMQNYCDDIIITVDDDIVYSKDTFFYLVNSFMKHPNAISANRVHKMVFDSNNIIQPYQKWNFEYGGMTEPSFKLFATGVGGVLYPPHIMPIETFNKKMIIKTAVYADDIWLKIHELMNQVPVVWTSKNPQHPKQIIGTKECALYKTNKIQNDLFLKNIVGAYDINIYDLCL